MIELLIATPAPRFREPHSFQNDVSIRQISPILWERSITKRFVSPADQEKLEHTSYWLCVQKEIHGFHDTIDDGFYKIAQNAAIALQIACPSGAAHTFLALKRTDRGFDCVGSYHPRELIGSLLTRTRFPDEQQMRDFDNIFNGISRAQAEGVVRLVNPVVLLEHGLQMNEIHLRTLILVMGTDMLFMAGEIRSFVERVGGFLGVHTLLFPPDSFFQVQPRTLVGEVLSDLYDLRNVIAHGQVIPEVPFRQKHELLGVHGERVIPYGSNEDFYYAQLMHESALYILTASLRRILTEGLFDALKDKRTWKAEMKACEQRYRAAGGKPPAKRRGR